MDKLTLFGDPQCGDRPELGLDCEDGAYVMVEVGSRAEALALAARMRELADELTRWDS